LVANATGTLGNWHWHLLVGRTFVELTLLQSVQVQVVKDKSGKVTDILMDKKYSESAIEKGRSEDL
jgi:hypothetical protein